MNVYCVTNIKSIFEASELCPRYKVARGMMIWVVGSFHPC